MTDPRRPIALTHDEAMDLAAGFVLDALDDVDAAAVREHLASCPESHDEMFELAEAVPALAAAAPTVEPPSSLRDRIMAAAALDLEEREGREGLHEPVAFPSGPERAARAERTRGGFGAWALGLAAVLAIAVLGGWNLLLQGQLNADDAYEQGVAAVLDAAAQPGALSAVLRGEATGVAAVTSDGNMTLAVQDLTPTSGTEVYEAWVIGADGVPVPLGDFKVGTAGTGTFTAPGLPTEPGIVLALTREPGPGATTPTMPIVSAGQATAAG
jgi:hypothetical protein